MARIAQVDEEVPVHKITRWPVDAMLASRFSVGRVILLGDAAHRQIQSDGAILVRPDRSIAWRAPTAVSDPRAALAGAFGQILGRPVASRVAVTA